MIKILFSREAGAFDVFVEDADGGIVLVIAETGFHLRPQRTNQADVVIGAAPWRQVFWIYVAGVFKRVRRSPGNLFDGDLPVRFRAGFVAPFQSPTIRAAATETD